MAAISSVQAKSEGIDLFACDLKEDMVTLFVEHYGFFSPKEGAQGTVQINRSWFVWPYATFTDFNPLCLRTWYVLRNNEGEIEAMAAQTWLSLFPHLPGIHWIATKIFGDLKYSADYTIWNGAGQPIGLIDGRMVSLDIRFDLHDRDGLTTANVRIGSDNKYANIYRKDTTGKIGEIKIDCETREKGDYKVACNCSDIDLRTLKLFSVIAVRESLINVEEAGDPPCADVV